MKYEVWTFCSAPEFKQRQGVVSITVFSNEIEAREYVRNSTGRKYSVWPTYLQIREIDEESQHNES